MDIEQETVSRETISADKELREIEAGLNRLLDFMHRDPAVTEAMREFTQELYEHLKAVKLVDQAEAKLAANRVDRERYRKHHWEIAS